MKRSTFLATSGSAVALVATVFAGIAPSSPAIAESKRKPTPTPTQTTPPPVVADGPGCYSYDDADFFWHRDTAPDGTKYTSGALSASIYLNSDSCLGTTYRLQVIETTNGTTIATFTETGNHTGTAAVALAGTLSATTPATADTGDAYKCVEVFLDALQNGVVVRRVPANSVFGIAVCDDGTGSPGGTAFN